MSISLNGVINVSSEYDKLISQVYASIEFTREDICKSEFLTVDVSGYTGCFLASWNTCTNITNLPIINATHRHIVLKCHRRAAYEIHNARGKHNSHLKTYFLTSYGMENTQFSTHLQSSSRFCGGIAMYITLLTGVKNVAQIQEAS